MKKYKILRTFVFLAIIFVFALIMIAPSTDANLIKKIFGGASNTGVESYQQFYVEKKTNTLLDNTWTQEEAIEAIVRAIEVSKKARDEAMRKIAELRGEVEQLKQ